MNEKKLEMWGVKGCTQGDSVLLAEVITPDFPSSPKMQDRDEGTAQTVPVKRNWAVRNSSLSGRIKCQAKAE